MGGAICSSFPACSASCSSSSWPSARRLSISFLDWGLTGPKGFAGLANYRELLRDPVFWRTCSNTVFYIVTIVPLQLALGLVMALR